MPNKLILLEFRLPLNEMFLTSSTGVCGTQIELPIANYLYAGVRGILTTNLRNVHKIFLEELYEFVIFYCHLGVEMQDALN